MRHNHLFAAVSALVVAAACVSPKAEQRADFFAAQHKVYSIEDFGARSFSGEDAQGAFDCTQAINACIATCSGNGGGVVSVPAGRWLTSTVHLKDSVILRLEQGSELVAVTDPEQYQSYIPTHDMSRYDSGEGTVNSNNSKDVRWNRALVLGVGLCNVGIEGPGKINGCHVFDPHGEESMRGPHTLLLAECRRVQLRDFTIERAANYAVMCYALEDAEISGLNIKEGWDGVHIRGGENVSIGDCRFETGDDSIAGGYWKNMVIKDCYINSSCNGIRMIMPCDGLVIEGCTFEGPGHYPHRTSGEARRCNMLFGISLEPGGWGAAPGDVRGVVIKDCVMSCLSSPISVSLAKDNHGYDLTVENVTATGLTGTVSPTVCWNDSGFDRITVGNFVVAK